MRKLHHKIICNYIAVKSGLISRTEFEYHTLRSIKKYTTKLIIKMLLMFFLLTVIIHLIF